MDNSLIDIINKIDGMDIINFIFKNPPLFIYIFS